MIKITLDFNFIQKSAHTKQGIKILERFITDICYCEKKWTTENIIEDLLEKIKAQVGNQKVLLGAFRRC